jgi:hypothetical protein
VPSSLLLGVTTYITTDVASIPLLWVVPLSLYLTTFIVAFGRRGAITGGWLPKAQAMGIVLIFINGVFGVNGVSLPMTIGIHLAVFFLTALLFHVQLADQRPGVSRLTEFYLCLAVGGAAGGIFNALIAPLIFSSAYEYYIVLVASCALRVLFRNALFRPNWQDIFFPALLTFAALGLFHLANVTQHIGIVGSFALLLLCGLTIYAFRQRPIRFALGFGGAMGTMPLFHYGAGALVYQERSFFGVYKVVEREAKGGRRVDLTHGTTVHGAEWLDPLRRREPLFYYHRAGPIGQVFTLFPPAHAVGVIGPGTGALACYARPSQDWTFYEIDAAVERLARNRKYFHYLEDCGADVKVVLGDGRLSIDNAANRTYDLLIIDAFSSDAIPVHLLTVEALRTYLRKIGEHGIVVFHISNTHLRLWPVVAANRRRLSV